MVEEDDEEEGMEAPTKKTTVSKKKGKSSGESYSFITDYYDNPNNKAFDEDIDLDDV